MDQPKRPSDKTYSEVMNEWAAQRNFVKGNRSRVIHPPWDAHPAAKAFGYTWRLLLLIIVPTVVYVILLMNYVKSNDFTRQFSTGLASTLNAEQVDVKSASWKLDGMLAIKVLGADGGPEAFYEKLEARNIGTRLPIPAVFQRAWVLHRVSMESLDISLRSGARGEMPAYETLPEDLINLPSLPPPATEVPGKTPDATLQFDLPAPKTGAVVAPMPAPRVLRAGYGIEPDFSILRINALQVAKLTAAWGSGPATLGGLAGMQTDFVRTAAGWVISGNGGTFSQGWLEGFNLEKLAAELQPDQAVIKEAVLLRHGGGKGTMTGRVKLGEFPEVEAEMKLEKIQPETLVSVAAASLFTAEADGSLKLSGSLNRSTGIKMEGTLQLLSGRINGLPVLKALNQLTGEEQFRLLSIRSGKVDFTTSGSGEHGGQIVEINFFEADCGPLARLKGTYRQEKMRDGGDLSGANAVERVKIDGEVLFGIPATITGKMKPATVAKFFKADGNGWLWITLPVEGPFTQAWTREIAADMLVTDSAKP